MAGEGCSVGLQGGYGGAFLSARRGGGRGTFQYSPAAYVHCHCTCPIIHHFKKPLLRLSPIKVVVAAHAARLVECEAAANSRYTTRLDDLEESTVLTVEAADAEIKG